MLSVVLLPIQWKCSKLHSFSTPKITEIKPDAAALDSVLIIPFLDGATMYNLKQELPVHLAKAAEISPQYDPLQSWKMNSMKLPFWSAPLLKVLLIHPSSAAAERVFSLLNAKFSDQQDHSLQDYVELSLMYQYTKWWDSYIMYPLQNVQWSHRENNW